MSTPAFKIEYIDAAGEVGRDLPLYGRTLRLPIYARLLVADGPRCSFTVAGCFSMRKDQFEALRAAFAIARFEQVKPWEQKADGSNNDNAGH